MDLEVALCAGLLVALLTDALDGMSSRRPKLTSDFGSAFNSLADNLLAQSAMIWLLILRPQIFILQIGHLCDRHRNLRAVAELGMVEISAFCESSPLHFHSCWMGTIHLVNPCLDHRRIQPGIILPDLTLVYPVANRNPPSSTQPI